MQTVFSFYINCGGRAGPFAGVDFEDTEEVESGQGNSISGFTQVEVAQVGSYAALGLDRRALFWLK